MKYLGIAHGIVLQKLRVPELELNKFIFYSNFYLLLRIVEQLLLIICQKFIKYEKRSGCFCNRTRLQIFGAVLRVEDTDSDKLCD